MLVKKTPFKKKTQVQREENRVRFPRLALSMYMAKQPYLRLRNWFNGLDTFMVAFTLLCFFTVLFFSIQILYPKFTITSQNLSFVKNKEYKSINTQAMLIIAILIRQALNKIWIRYKKKPLGNILHG